MIFKAIPAREGAAALLVVAAALLTTAAGVALGVPVVLLVLNAVPPWLVFVDRLRKERYAAALWIMVLWAFVQTVAIIAAVQIAPAETARAVLHGPAYRDEMFHWIRTGEGLEGQWRLFLPRHALHYAAFLIASALTAGGAGILFGTALLNYMSFYVGSLFLADQGGHFTGRLILMGFPVWAIFRVIGFIAGAVAAGDLTLFVIARLKDRPRRWPGPVSYYISLSLALVILDALLKALLAPEWRHGLLTAIMTSPAPGR